MNRQRC